MSECIKCINCGEDIKDNTFCSLLCKQGYMKDLLEGDMVDRARDGLVNELKMKPFKEGDVIRRTHNNLPHMQSDSIHTVTRVDNLVVFLEGQRGSFHSSYFQHWTPKEPLREPHPHADVICHHVKGGDIEYLDVHEIWMPVLHWATRVNSGLGERFMTSTKYRIKPELTEREVEIVRIEEAITKLSDDLYSLKMGG